MDPANGTIEYHRIWEREDIRHILDEPFGSWEIPEEIRTAHSIEEYDRHRGLVGGRLRNAGESPHRIDRKHTARREPGTWGAKHQFVSRTWWLVRYIRLCPKCDLIPC